MNIVKAPNSVLSSVAKSVTKIDKQVLDFIAEMKKTLAETKDPEGVGLAAPQVGKSLQIFIMKPDSDSPFSVFINPVIEKITEQKNEKGKKDVKKKTKKSPQKLEGCLSLPQIWGFVKRSPSINVSYMDEDGKIHKKNFKGFNATIIQHETDHLNGILFPKKVLEQQGTLYKSSKNEKGEDEFEEIEI